MWADNEADLDLLGFGFLVDGLVVALTEPRLLPVTVGVLGDWGSGKSSLMRLAAAELCATASPDGGGEPYVVVEFSPWQHEDFDDVKIALMSTVLDAVARRVPAEYDERVGRLRAFLKGLRHLGRRAARLLGATSGALAAVAMSDADPETVALVSKVTQAAMVEAEGALADTPRDDPPPAGRESAAPVEDVREFRSEFRALLEAATDVDAVVVFIDDLDRCMPATIVDTFEAIRLFLNEPKTAYVLAVNQNVVEAAIDSRYPELVKSDGAGLGRDYLEKIIQLNIAIPPLSAPEAESYANLLFANLHLEEADLATVLARAEQLRASSALSVVFNAGIAADVLDTVPPALTEDLLWSAQIMPILGSSLRGNPRQLKRFLNNLLLKHRSARRRGVELELPVLAKLLVLDQQHHTDFQRVFDWQVGLDGPSPQLASAERIARGPARDLEPNEPTPAKPASKKAAETSPEDEAVREWALKPHIADWLRIDPELAGLDLGKYFTYSRDRLSFGVSVSRLAPHLQELLVQVLGDVDQERRSHYPSVHALESGERAQLIEALLERVQRAPASTAVTAVIELAGLNADVLDSVCEGLRRIPVSAVPVSAGMHAVRRLPTDHPAVAQLLTYWREQGGKSMETVITKALAAGTKAGSRGNL